MRDVLLFGIGYREPYEDQEEVDNSDLGPALYDGREADAIVNLLDAGMADMEIASTPTGWQN